MASRGTPAATSPQALRRMKSQRQRDTAAEKLVRSLLHRSGFRFRVQYPLPNLRRRADVAFPRLRVAVFIDGCFWHGCPEHGTWPKENASWWREKLERNQRRDRETNDRLRDAGWLVLRFWDHDDPETASSVVVQVLSERTASRRARSPAAI